MPRSLKISEELYEMLWCIKPFPSMSFNDVILMLIEDEVPHLPSEMRRIRKLNETNPESANSELDILKKQIFQYYIADLLLRKKEREDEALAEEFYEQQLAEDEKKKKGKKMISKSYSGLYESPIEQRSVEISQFCWSIGHPGMPYETVGSIKGIFA